jgi:hypothetical protein
MVDERRALTTKAVRHNDDRSKVLFGQKIPNLIGGIETHAPPGESAGAPRPAVPQTAPRSCRARSVAPDGRGPFEVHVPARGCLRQRRGVCYG